MSMDGPKKLQIYNVYTLERKGKKEEAKGKAPGKKGRKKEKREQLELHCTSARGILQMTGFSGIG